MSKRRGVVLEIEGQAVAYATQQSAPTTYATTVRDAIIRIPQGSILSVDFDSFKASTGGTDVELNDCATEKLHFASGIFYPTALLTSKISKTATTLTVDSTSGFASSGTVWLGREAVSYTGTTATTFTGLTRAQLGTRASAHTSGAVIYSYNPTLLKRKCTLKWYDLDDQSLETTRYTGYIDAVDFSSTGYRFSIISAKQEFEDAVALSAEYGKARLSPRPKTDPNDATTLYFGFSSDVQGEFFTTASNASNWSFFYLRVGNELLRYEGGNVKTTAWTAQVQTVTSAYKCNIDNIDGFERGKMIEFTDGSGGILGQGIIAKVEGTTWPAGDITHSAGYTPTVGQDVQVGNVSRVTDCERAALWTYLERPQENAEATEYRVLEGNQVDILLWMMLSIDGDKTNTDYDILPEGWGAGIDSSLIDIEAFEDLLRPRASFRRYAWQEEVQILDFIGMIAAQTNSRIYWGIDGVLTVKPISDVFPMDSSAKAISVSNLLSGQIPSLRIDLTQIRNIWEWGSDYDLDGDKRGVLRVSIEESRRLYGDLPMPKQEDKGMRQVESLGVTYPVVEALLSHRSAPVTILSAQIIFDEDATYHPGELVLVTIPVLPNMAGVEGITSEYFEVLSYEPEEESATATITLAKRMNPDNLGHVAMAGIVEAVAGSVVTMRDRAYTKYAPKAASYSPKGNTSYDGTEDVHWFLAGDAIHFVDASTLGNATPTTAQTTISSVDYATRKITVASVPAWLAADDLVRLDNWANVKASTQAANRQDVFICLADDTTELVDADLPYRWGI